jgi:hypothetical protein
MRVFAAAVLFAVTICALLAFAAGRPPAVEVDQPGPEEQYEPVEAPYDFSAVCVVPQEGETPARGNAVRGVALAQA